MVVCPWIFLYLLGGFSLIFFRFFNAGLPDFRGPVWLFVRGSFCIYSAGFCSFFCFFPAGFPDFRLPRAPEQGGAPRLPAEEAAAAGACAPASSASLGLERMLTEMQMQCGWKESGDTEGKDETPIGRGKVGGGGGGGGQEPVKTAGCTEWGNS